MFQTIDGVDCFVVDLDQDPKTLLPIHDDGNPELTPYAQALNIAIQKGEIKEPGKYAINITDSGKFYTVFHIEE